MGSKKAARRTTREWLGYLKTAGKRGAFESPAVLTEEPNALGEWAVRHANNLYVYDANSEKLKFVTELCSGPGLSGSEKAGVIPQNQHQITAKNAVPDAECPASVSPFIDAFIANNDNDTILWEPGSGRSTMTAKRQRPASSRAGVSWYPATLTKLSTCTATPSRRANSRGFLPDAMAMTATVTTMLFQSNSPAPAVVSLRPRPPRGRQLSGHLGRWLHGDLRTRGAARLPRHEHRGPSGLRRT